MAMILDASVGTCIKMIEETIQDEVKLISGVKEELKRLQKRIKRIECVLNDAGRRSIQESTVKNWLNELKDVMYDAEDVIESCRFKGRTLLEGDSASSSSSRYSTTLSRFSIFSCFSSAGFRHEIANQVREVNKKLGDVLNDKIVSTFAKIKPAAQISAPRGEQSSQLEPPIVVGKEIGYATTELVEVILKKEEPKFHKVVIHGMAGIGKTTLAQKVFNDPKIQDRFEHKIWVCVSQRYSEVGLLKEILRKVGHNAEGDTVGELQSTLADLIKERNFFLVLDDVWKPEVWTKLLEPPLLKAANGTVLATTRDRTIALRIGAEYTHSVETMSVDSGWELLWRSAYFCEDEVQGLKGIGIQIVEKCGRLPLTIKAIAGVLTEKDQTPTEWESVLRSDYWSLSSLPEDLRGAIYLSYDNLSPHLKQCFLFCSLYEEDDGMSLDDLVRFWVAEGCVEEKQGQLLEDTAEQYYYELIRKGLLLPNLLSSDERGCKMHDLFRSLAQHLSRDESACRDPELPSGTSMSKLRHITITSKEEKVPFPGSEGQRLRLRTLLIFGDLLRIENRIFQRTPYLRVLRLNGKGITSIPDSIGNLIHLRMLNLNYTSVSTLPETVKSLTNLQMLDLQHCECLYALPVAITQLCNLRRLGLYCTPLNLQMLVPKGIASLQFLNDLVDYPVGDDCGSTEMQDGWSLEELGPLTHLRRLRMVRLERAVSCGVTSLLRTKSHLKYLDFVYTESTGQQYPEEKINKIDDIFEKLSPPTNVEQLGIVGFFGRRHPSWMLESSLSSLKHLILNKCISWEQLPPVGQLPNLRYMEIKGASAVVRIGPEFLGGGAIKTGSYTSTAFPKLEWLIIKDMPNWEDWYLGDEEEAGEEKGAATNEKAIAPYPSLKVLPRLQVLQLAGCPKLRALPQQLAQATSMKELYIRNAPAIKAVENLIFLSDWIEVYDCDSLEWISNLPRVRELRVAGCPALRCPDSLDALQQLWLSKELKDSPPSWVSELQIRRRQLHGDDLDLYTLHQ